MSGGDNVLKRDKMNTNAERIKQIIRQCFVEAISEKRVNGLSSLNENIKQPIDENRVVTFGKPRVYPNFGWCVILAGSGGSGKGRVSSTLIPIDAQVINVDDWKEKYAKMHNLSYDSTNAKEVYQMHRNVANAGWKKKRIDNFFNSNAHKKEMLPNVMFDMTAKNPYTDVVSVASQAQSVGYKTMLVWVIATRSETLIRNLERDRRVPDSVLHRTYNSLMRQMPEFLQSREAANCLDEAWLVFNSAPTIDRSDLEGDELKTACVQLTRASNQFFINKDTMQKLVQYLGKEEVNPDNPQTFLSSNEIMAKYKKDKEVKKGDKTFYKFGREQFDPQKQLYR